MIVKFLKYLLFIFFIPFWFLQLLIPRDKNIWIFGAWFGQRYSDNSKVLYEHVLSNPGIIKPVWITKNRQIYDSLIKEGKPCLMANSFIGIITSLKAGCVIFSSGKTDVNHFFINGSKTIQTWHGSPMKKIGLDNKFSRNSSNVMIKRYLFPFLWDYDFTACVSTAEIFNKYLESAFDLKPNQILTTGYPRNDVFFSNEKTSFLIKNWNIKFDNPKKIIYLPTFRDYNPNVDLFKDFNFNYWNEFLNSNNYILIFKGHFASNSVSINSSSKRIIQLKDKDVSDINLILKDVDLLITDYSGAYFDFELAQKPVILAPFDFETYIKSRELYFDYFSDFFHPIAFNWHDVLGMLKSQNFTKGKRQILRYNKFNDGNSSERLFYSIKNILF